MCDEPNVSKDVSENLAKKVDKLKIDEEIYQEAENLEEETTKNRVQEGILQKNLIDDREEDKVNVPKATTNQPETLNDENISQRTTIPIRIEPYLRWLRDHPLESVIGDVREGIRMRRST